MREGEETSSQEIDRYSKKGNGTSCFGNDRRVQKSVRQGAMKGVCLSRLKGLEQKPEVGGGYGHLFRNGRMENGVLRTSTDVSAGGGASRLPSLDRGSAGGAHRDWGAWDYGIMGLWDLDVNGPRIHGPYSDTDQGGEAEVESDPARMQAAQ